MPSAARVGDPTSHQTPLTGIGSHNVFIGEQPAWRALIDVHTCPLSTPNPHAGGVVQKGSTKVFINAMSAVRQGDMIVETGGPPNVITGGYFKVQIGG